MAVDASKRWRMGGCGGLSLSIRDNCRVAVIAAFSHRCSAVLPSRRSDILHLLRPNDGQSAHPSTATGIARLPTPSRAPNTFHARRRPPHVHLSSSIHLTRRRRHLSCQHPFFCWIEQTQAELARCPRGNVSVDSVVIWCCPVVDTVVSSNVEFEDTHTQSQNLNRLSLMLSERRSIELLNLPLPSSHTHSTSHVLYCNYECHLSPGKPIRRERQFTLPSPHLTEIAPTAELKAPLLPPPPYLF